MTSSFWKAVLSHPHCHSWSISIAWLVICPSLSIIGGVAVSCQGLVLCWPIVEASKVGQVSKSALALHLGLANKDSHGGHLVDDDLSTRRTSASSIRRQ